MQWESQRSSSHPKIFPPPLISIAFGRKRKPVDHSTTAIWGHCLRGRPPPTHPPASVLVGLLVAIWRPLDCGRRDSFDYQWRMDGRNRLKSAVGKKGVCSGI